LCWCRFAVISLLAEHCGVLLTVAFPAHLLLGFTECLLSLRDCSCRTTALHPTAAEARWF
jgi:hypothetical protein